MIHLLTLTKIKGRDRIEMKVVNNVPTIDVKIKDTKLALLVDTGATVCVLHENVFNKLNGEFKLKRYETLHTATGDGNAYPVYDIEMQIKTQILQGEVIVLPYKKNNSKYDGIIGVPALRCLKACVDFEHNNILAELDNDVEDD